MTSRDVATPVQSEAERPQTVLVVDDDSRVRSLLRKMLEADRIAVVVAEDGASALDRFFAVRPDLVLLDVVIPQVDGFDVCRRLKESAEGRLVPIILITGLDAQEDRIVGIEAGADDFLSKPFDKVELLARVRSLLRVKRYTDELEHAESMLMMLGRVIEERDAYTLGHCERLATLSAAMARRLGLSNADIQDLERAAYLHDIGKVAIPDAILKKAGPLTPEERRVMQEHAEVGERICRGLRSLSGVLPIVRHHHERMDGSGYPDGLGGNAIPLGARILQLADVYDALTTERPYKAALAATEALQTMREEVERGWWDADLFGTFHELLMESPQRL